MWSIVPRSVVKKRVETNLRSCLPYLKSSKTVLDIGAGNGVTDEIIQKKFPKVRITALDIGDYRWEKNKNILHVVYQGDTMPFHDKTFDTSLLFFTVHHATDQEKLLAESVRVTKKYILIWEEVYTSVFQRFFMEWYDRFVNFLLLGELISKPEFSTDDVWRARFKKHNLKLLEAHYQKASIMPLRVLYIVSC